MITITHYNCLLYILSLVSCDKKHPCKCLSLIINILNINNITLPHNTNDNMKIALIVHVESLILIVYSNYQHRYIV